MDQSWGIQLLELVEPNIDSFGLLTVWAKTILKIFVIFLYRQVTRVNAKLLPLRILDILEQN